MEGGRRSGRGPGPHEGSKPLWNGAASLSPTSQAACGWMNSPETSRHLDPGGEVELRGISTVLRLRWPPPQVLPDRQGDQSRLTGPEGTGYAHEREHPDMEEMGRVFSLSFSDQEQQPHPGRGSALGN